MDKLLLAHIAFHRMDNHAFLIMELIAIIKLDTNAQQLIELIQKISHIVYLMTTKHVIKM